MRSTLVTAASLALLAFGCSSGEDAAPALANAKAQFETANLASYSFTWTESCFCDTSRVRATRVSVAGDAITRAVYVDDQTATQNASIRTIDGVFDWIQSGYDKGYDVVQVTYDPQLGYPMAVYFDPAANASDEETSVSLTDFVTPADAP